MLESDEKYTLSPSISAPFEIKYDSNSESMATVLSCSLLMMK